MTTAQDLVDAIALCRAYAAACEAGKGGKS